MKTQSIVRWLMGVALFVLPSTSFAAVTTIQDMQGGAGVSMNYKTGPDEFLVNNLGGGSSLVWDIYQTSTPETPDSWVLDRTYTISDFPELNQDYVYDLYSGPAVRYKGDWYFVSRANSLGESSTIVEQIDVWRVSGHGEKPELVFSSDNDYTNYYYGLHSPLLVWGNYLLFVDSTGAMYGSVDGNTWDGPGQIDMLEGGLIRNDLVANGSTLYLSIDGEIFKSTDSDVWTSLGDLCADSDADACEVKSLVARPGHGVIAIVSERTGDATVNTLMVYKHSEWVAGDTFSGLLSGLERFGKKIIMTHFQGASYNQYDVERITPMGRIDRIIYKRSGAPMAVLAKRYVLINKPSSEYVTIMRFTLN